MFQLRVYYKWSRAKAQRSIPTVKILGRAVQLKLHIAHVAIYDDYQPPIK